MLQPLLQDDRFLFLETLGRGGMAAVYRAFDRLEQRIVALKVDHEGGPRGPGHPLAIEFDAWSRLAHPNIVGARALCHARSGPLPAGRPYLVLEHVDGGSVEQVLRPGCADAETLEDLGAQMLAGLAHIHDSGYVHRDLKPANVIVDPHAAVERRFKLTDFGLVAPSGVAEPPGCFSGSLPYVAPESLTGGPVDGRADLYSLGILLFQLATGRLPAAGRKPEALLRWHLGGRRVDPRQLRPSLPVRLARLIRRLIARRREARPADPAAALGLLGRPAPRGPTAVVEAPRAERARLRLALDAARLGDRRRLPLEGRLLAEVRRWCSLQGATHVSLTPGPEGLARLVLELFGARPDLYRVLDRHDLLGRLPIEWVGGQPLVDGSRRCGTAASRDGQAVGRLLLDQRGGRGPLVLTVAAAVACPLLQALVATVRQAIAHRPGPDATRRGLVLLEVSPRQPATARDNSAPGSGCDAVASRS